MTLEQQPSESKSNDGKKQQEQAPKLKADLTHLFSYNITLRPQFEVIGPTPDGLRINVYVSGGEARGPKLRGTFLPVGGDWFLIRPDGIAITNVRCTLQTDDGALIYVTHLGMSDLGAGAYEKAMKGEPIPPGSAITSTPNFQTAHPAYQWMHRAQFLMVGQAFFEVPEVRCEVYQVQGRPVDQGCGR
jgi:hypothetical protein